MDATSRNKLLIHLRENYQYILEKIANICQRKIKIYFRENYQYILEKIANIFQRPIKIYIRQRKLLIYFRENYPYILDKITHLSQSRKKQKTNQKYLTENHFNFQHLGGFLPILKGRKTSKIKPEFVIFDPLRGESQSSSLLPLSSIDTFFIIAAFFIISAFIINCRIFHLCNLMFNSLRCELVTCIQEKLLLKDNLFIHLQYKDSVGKAWFRIFKQMCCNILSYFDDLCTTLNWAFLVRPWKRQDLDLFHFEWEFIEFLWLGLSPPCGFT